MRKWGVWLAVAAIAITALMILMWRQLEPTGATAAPPIVARSVASAPSVPLGTTKPALQPVPDAMPAAPAKLDVQSDAFFYKFQEVVPSVLTRNAATCYEGISKHVHRNQKLVLKFKVKIKDGEVTINDVKTDVDTLDNAGLASCFLQAVQRTTWKNDELPDWEAEDELVLRPERGMKKFMRDNIDYVGQPAPRD